MGFQYVRLANEIEQQILSGKYGAGEKLPSLRKLHASTGRSISTVYQAYSELENRGVVEVREKSGFYARPLLSNILPLPSKGKKQIKPHKVTINVLSGMHQRTLNNSEMIPFGAANPAAELLPGKQLAAAVRKVASEYQNSGRLAYGFPSGEPELQKEIVRRSLGLQEKSGEEEIVVTHGCMSAIDLCLRSVAHPGDIVLLESPTFLCYLQLIEDLNMQALEVPADPEKGLNINALQQILDEHDVRTALLNSTFHNPLGFEMERQAKEQLVKLFAERGIPIIEDDIYGELYFGGTRPTPLKAFDQQGGVLYCSSFSKSMAPDLRVGWTMPGRFREKVKRLKFNATISSSQLNQLVVAEFIRNGGYDRHLRKMRNSLKKQASEMAHAVARYFPQATKISAPKGGLCLWVELPESVDSLQLCRLAEKKNISIVPGALCSGMGQYDHCIRLNFANPWNERIEKGIRVLAELTISLMKNRTGEKTRTTEASNETRIGLNTDPDFLKLDALCKQLNIKNPKGEIHIHQSISGNILKLISSHELHGGFVFGDCDELKFHVQPLETYRLRIVGPTGMAAIFATGDYRDLATLPWIGNPPDCPYCQVMEQIFYTRGFQPKTAIIANDEPAILNMIKAGMGLNFMLEEPARKLEKDGDLVIWEKEHFAFPLSFVSLKSEQVVRKVEAMVEAIGEIWQR
jgi:DNA-binding transcriptional MocR family regulator/DNA-binding transcriptional LysR family regulator